MHVKNVTKNRTTEVVLLIEKDNHVGVLPHKTTTTKNNLPLKRSRISDPGHHLIKFNFNPSDFPFSLFFDGPQDTPNLFIPSENKKFNNFVGLFLNRTGKKGKLLQKSFKELIDLKKLENLNPVQNEILNPVQNEVINPAPVSVLSREVYFEPQEVDFVPQIEEV